MEHMTPATAQKALTTEEREQRLDAAPAHQDIASLAYALWQERGCPEGSPEVDWFRAEEELSSGATVADAQRL